MMRQLSALAVVGILGAALAGDAEACHKKKCGGGCAPVVVSYAQPAYSSCGHKAKKCGGGCHKKKTACYTTVVAYNNYASYPTVAPSGQYMGTPQATGQSNMMTPPVPSKR